MKQIDDQQLKRLLEAALLVSPKPLSIRQMLDSILCEYQVGSTRVKQALQGLAQDYRDRGIQLDSSAGAYRFISAADLSHQLSYLWTERAPKYSKALLETLALVAYRQPITRGEIERVRGVAVSSNIVRTLLERDWIKVLGHKEVPGRPALYGTTNEFLHYFCLEGLADLPALHDDHALSALFSQGQNESETQTH